MSDNMNDDHEHFSDGHFFKLFSIMIGGMVTLTVLLIILANAVGGDAGSKVSDVQAKATLEQVALRTKPEGSMNIGEVAAVANTSTESAKAPSGEEIYNVSCVACHASGVAGAPKLSDAAAWETRLAQGTDLLYEHAINGFNSMPAKGGNTALSDDAVKAAVDYMLTKTN